MLNLIQFLLCDLLLELCLSAKRVSDLWLGGDPGGRHSQLMGLCLKELVGSTNWGVSFCTSHKDKDSSPRQNGIGSEENRYLYLERPWSWATLHGTMSSSALANQESHRVETPCSGATIVLCCLGLQILACEHFFWKAACSNNLRLTRKSSSLASVIYTWKCLTSR